MNKIKLFPIGLLFLLLALYSCREEFNDHYDSKGNTTIDKNIVEVLREKPEFSLFVKAIDHLDLAVTLGKAGIYTCLAPRNEDVEKFLAEKNAGSIEAIAEGDLREWVNYHFISGMMYYYDFDKKFQKASKEGLDYPSQTMYKTREESKYPGKYIQVYTPTYFAERASDYKYLYGKDGNDFMVNDVRISDTERDIDAANGVIHVLEAPLSVPLRADKALMADPELSILSKWSEGFALYRIVGEDDFGKIDTTKIKYYDYGAPLATETAPFTMFAPTDEAIMEFFGPYLGNFENDIQKVPVQLQVYILNALSSGYNVGARVFWGMKDITRNWPYFITSSFVYTRLANDIEPNYIGCTPSSNGVIYKVKKMILPPVLDAVEGGIYMHQATYKHWGTMVNYLSTGTDILTYQHGPKTMLVQPDQYWDKPMDDYTTDYRRDTLRYILGAGMINENVKEFTHRYYSTSYGSILYEDGGFIDYTGKKVNVVSNGPTWDGSNGSIFEIDGFLNPITPLFDTLDIYTFRINEMNRPDAEKKYTQFATACELVPGLISQLKQGGYFNYTVFAPTNDAINDANIDIAHMTEEELTTFVKRQIVSAKVFTDGSFSNGNITFQNLLKETVRFSGSWEGFQVTDPSGNYISINPGEANQQANNGVLHGISTVFKGKQ